MAQGFSSIIRDEDYAMGEAQQTAANANSLEFVLFGRNEASVIARPIQVAASIVHLATLASEPPLLIIACPLKHRGCIPRTGSSLAIS